MYKPMGVRHSNWHLFLNNQYVSYALLSWVGSIIIGDSTPYTTNTVNSALCHCLTTVDIHSWQYTVCFFYYTSMDSKSKIKASFLIPGRIRPAWRIIHTGTFSIFSPLAARKMRSFRKGGNSICKMSREKVVVSSLPFKAICRNIGAKPLKIGAEFFHEK